MKTILFHVLALSLLAGFIGCYKKSTPTHSEAMVSVEQCQKQQQLMLENLCEKDQNASICFLLSSKAPVHSADKARYEDLLVKAQAFACQGGDPDANLKACYWLVNHYPEKSHNREIYQEAVDRYLRYMRNAH